MTPQEIEDTKTIAKFMGYTIYPNDCFIKPASMTHILEREIPKYHTSWDWLMPVVEKIEKLKHDGFGYKVIIDDNYCCIWQIKGRVGGTIKWESSKPYTKDLGNGRSESGTLRPETKIEAVFITVVKFLKWYNLYAITQKMY